MYEFQQEDWHMCKICNLQITDLAKIYGGTGVYYTEVFKKHCSIDHNISIDEYFIKWCNYTQPTCICGICKKISKVSFKNNKKTFGWREYMCGRNPGLIKWAETAKTDRCGENNPMFGKTAWNSGLSKETNELVRLVSEKRKGKKLSEEHKKKLSKFQSSRIKEPHKGCKHTDINKEKFRENTLKGIKEGRYSQIKSKPHVKMAEILSSLDIKFEEEKQVSYWSFDFYLIKEDYYLEVDGDYFHSNPKIYPDGPKSETQKINFARDNKKNEYCQSNNLSLIRFWECDILNNEEFIKELLCNLKK